MAALHLGQAQFEFVCGQRRPRPGQALLRGHGLGQEAAEDERAFDVVAQFAHIAGPGVRAELPEHLVRQRQRRHPQRRGELLHEVVHELRDVLRIFAQAGQADVDDREPVVEILAKAAGPDLGGEVAVGGRNDAHIDRHLAFSTHRTQRALFEHAQQPGLQSQRQLTDFVQEQAAAAGVVKQTVTVLAGAGESALHMAEELAFDQLRGDRRAVEGHEGAMRARAAVVQRARHHLLASARFALQEHGAGHGPDAADEGAQLFDGARASDQTHRLRRRAHRRWPGVRQRLHGVAADR